MAILGIILALVVLVVLSMKGFDLITVTSIAALVVIFTNGLDWQEALLDGYMTTFVGFTKSWLFVLVLGALFGKIMSESRSAHALAHYMTKLLGVKYSLLAIGIVECIFTLLGISGFVIMFVIAPLAQVMMYENRIPRTLLPAIVGLGTIPACGILPYSVDVTNLIPTQYLGTDLGAGPVLGIIGGLIIFVFGYIYIIRTTKKFQLSMSNEEIEATFAGVEFENQDSSQWPPLWKAAIPLVAVIVVILIAQNIMNTEAVTAVVLALFTACILGIALNVKKLTSINQLVRSGVENGLFSLATASAVLGFSGVVTLCPEFNNIIDGITNLNLHPYFVEYIGINVIAGVVGSSISGITVFMEQFSQRFLELGMNPIAMHRIATLAGAGLNTLPNSITASLTMAYTKLSYKDAYIHMFVTSVIIPLIAGLIITVLCILGFVY